MDFKTVGAEAFGRSLEGLGLDIPAADVPGLAGFLGVVFAMTMHRVNADFAILTYGDQLLQLHADHTYHGHPLPSLLSESGARGGGVEIRLYDTDPDAAAARAEAHPHASHLPPAPARVASRMASVPRRSRCTRTKASPSSTRASTTTTRRCGNCGGRSRNRTRWCPITGSARTTPRSAASSIGSGSAASAEQASPCADGGAESCYHPGATTRERPRCGGFPMTS